MPPLSEPTPRSSQSLADSAIYEDFCGGSLLGSYSTYEELINSKPGEDIEALKFSKLMVLF